MSKFYFSLVAREKERGWSRCKEQLGKQEKNTWLKIFRLLTDSWVGRWLRSQSAFLNLLKFIQNGLPGMLIFSRKEFIKILCKSSVLESVWDTFFFTPSSVLWSNVSKSCLHAFANVIALTWNAIILLFLLLTYLIL